jgi:hypothetical protein
MVEGARGIEWVSCLEELAVERVGNWQLGRFSLRVTPTGGPKGQVPWEGACGRHPGQDC